MYSRNSFGSYYPVNSCIHKLNPVIKLFNFIIILLLVILSTSLQLNLFIFILVFIMALLSYVPFKYYFNTFWSLRYLYILLAFVIAYFDYSISYYVVWLLKIISVIEYINILSYTTSPSESIYGIEKFLSFFNFLYLPISKFAFKVNSILRYYPLMLTVEHKTFKACASRGYDYYNSNIIKRGSVFLNVENNLKRLTDYKNKQTNFYSELRLYNIKKYRTNYRTNKVGFYDIFFTLFHLALVFTYLIESGIL